MKKLLILCLTFVFILASCGKGNQDKDKKSGVSSDSISMQSDIENPDNNSEENFDDSADQNDLSEFTEDFEDSDGQSNTDEFTDNFDDGNVQSDSEEFTDSFDDNTVQSDSEEFTDDFDDSNMQTDEEDSYYDGDEAYEDSVGGLTVEATVTKAEAALNRPADNSADILNPAIIKSAGANKQALAMRENILNSKDSISVSGTTYYVSEKGDDTNNGKSPETPFGTLNKAFGAAESGDAVLIERGSIFRLVNTVTLENGVSYGAYGTGPKPEIWGSLQNYADDSLWSPFTIRNVWAISYFGSDVGMIIFNHGELAGNMEYYVRNLKKNGDFFFDDVQKTLYVYCDKGNPGNVYSDIEIGSRKILFRLRNGAQNVTIDNISFRYTGTFGIHGSMGCKNIKISNCMIGWVGGSLFEDGSNRFGNGIEFTGGCQDLTVENCWIYQVYDAGFTFQITIPDTTPEEHTYKNINVKDNLIEYCSWAFEWWPSDSQCAFENILVDGNIMRFSGYGWAEDTRIPSHLRGSWSAKDFEIKNFMITNNIFDCSNGPVYAWTLYNDEQFANSLLGNEYYQKLPTATKKNVFEFEYSEKESSDYLASNQAEFDSVVKSVDSKATVIKWLG